jgi:hypothetical protein
LFLTGSLLLNVIVLVLLIEIVNPYFDIMLSKLCTDFCNKVSDSAIITWSSVKRSAFIYLFIVSCIPCILSVFDSESILFMYILKDIGKRKQPRHSPLLISTDCVILISSLFFISLCSYVLTSAESKGSGMFSYVIY